MRGLPRRVWGTIQSQAPVGRSHGQPRRARAYTGAQTKMAKTGKTDAMIIMIMMITMITMTTMITMIMT